MSCHGSFVCLLALSDDWEFNSFFPSAVANRALDSLRKESGFSPQNENMSH